MHRRVEAVAVTSCLSGHAVAASALLLTRRASRGVSRPPATRSTMAGWCGSTPRGLRPWVSVCVVSAVRRHSWITFGPQAHAGRQPRLPAKSEQQATRLKHNLAARSCSTCHDTNHLVGERTVMPLCDGRADERSAIACLDPFGEVQSEWHTLPLRLAANSGELAEVSPGGNRTWAEQGGG